MGHGVDKSMWTLSGLYFIHLFLQKSLTESLAHSQFSFAFLNVIPKSHNEKHGELSPKAPQKQKNKSLLITIETVLLFIWSLGPAIRLMVDNGLHFVFRSFLQYCVPFWTTLLKRGFTELQNIREREWARWLVAYKSCHMRNSWAHLNCRDIVLSGEVTAAFKQSKRLPGEGLVLYFSSEEKLQGANFD